MLAIGFLFVMASMGMLVIRDMCHLVQDSFVDSIFVVVFSIGIIFLIAGVTIWLWEVAP